MRITLRFKLVAIVAVAALSLLVLAVSSELYERRIETQIDSIRDNYLPKIRVRPKLESGFEKLWRTFQDAQDASDNDVLASTGPVRDALLATLKDSGDALTAGQIAALHLAIDDYYNTAAAVSKAMLAGDGGETATARMLDMQAKRSRVASLIESTTVFDEGELTASFDATRSMQQSGSTIRTAVSGVCLVLLLAISIWIGVGLFRSLGRLVDGFERFGRNDFGTPIEAATRDELGDVAEKANHMASHLQRLDRDRERSAWIRAGIVGLGDALRGELAPSEVADRACTHLARYLGAPVAALYHGPLGGPFELAGSYAVPVDKLPGRFALGEGLIGEAAKRSEITVVDAPEGLVLRSGLVEARPQALVFVPLARGREVTGVLELAIVGPWTEREAELVKQTSESIAIAMEVARQHAGTRRLLEQTRLQAAELERAGANLEQKATELAKASAYKSQFLASMSHELRTPLNAIIGFSEILHDGAIPIDDATAKEYLNDILTSGRHLLQLINDVLDLAKVESGKLELFPTPLKLSKVIGEVLTVLRSTAAKSSVQIKTEIAPEVEDLVLDPARLKQVLYNYVSNALKFTPERGSVTIRAMVESSMEVRIAVEDTGVGIAPADLQRLFGEFQQTAEGAKKAGSTGLGLALTKRIVEAQGGRVGVKSTVGTGSTFHAILPRIAGTTPLAPSKLPIVAPRAGAPTILVVEDDAGDRQKLVDTLSRAGYAVEAVTTGSEAVARCADHTYDAITLDLLLPDMTGLEVLERLRAGRNERVPVIVVTVVAERGAVAGFAVHDVLAKPLTESALLASLTRAGVDPDQGRSVVLVVDDDPASLKVMSATLSELGYRAVCEQDPVRGLASATAHPPSAIVLDLIMPTMSGFEFLAQLRAVPGAKDVPVIVWTSKDLSSDELAQLRRAAHGVIAKGAGNSGVVAEISSHLPARAAEGS